MDHDAAYEETDKKIHAAYTLEATGLENAGIAKHMYL